MLRKKRYIKITLQITSNMFYGFVSHESIKLRTILQKKNDIYFGNFFCRNTCNTRPVQQPVGGTAPGHGHQVAEGRRSRLVRLRGQQAIRLQAGHRGCGRVSDFNAISKSNQFLLYYFEV